MRVTHVKGADSYLMLLVGHSHSKHYEEVRGDGWVLWLHFYFLAV